MFTQHLFDNVGFTLVIELGGGAVRIDVVDFLRFDAGSVDGPVNSQYGATAIFR